MNLAPVPVARFYDNNGQPLANGQLFTYENGTTTKTASYKDQAGTPNTNPIRLNARGECDLWLPLAESITLTLAPADDTDPPAKAIYTRDNIAAPVVYSDLTQDFVGGLLYPQTQAESDAGVVPIAREYQPGNIRRYGAVVDGTTEDAPAFRKALDLAAVDGTPVTCKPAGDIKLASTVYIPQRAQPGGITIDLYGSTVVGQGKGTGTIFETGTGTVSTGGATNFGQPDESSGSLHYGTIIKGLRIQSCAIAFKLFNFIMGCELRDLFGVDLDTMVYTDRCFYLGLYEVKCQVASITAGKVLFDFNDTSNAMRIIGCVAAGGSGNTTGIGYQFTGGGAAIVFDGNTAEALSKGLKIASAIEGIEIVGNYFESCAAHGIDASAAGSKRINVDNNWFLSTTKAIEAAEWIAGRWGAANNLASSDPVTINDTVSQCLVELPAQIFTETSGIASAVRVPSNYTLGAAIALRAPREVYANASGLSAPLAVDAAAASLLNVPAFAFSGGASANGAECVPFDTVTKNSGSTVIDTPIVYNDYWMHVFFGIYAEINGAHIFAGIVTIQGNVVTFNSIGTFTITASNQAGMLRLTIAGSAHNTFTAGTVRGHVRHL